MVVMDHGPTGQSVLFRVVSELEQDIENVIAQNLKMVGCPASRLASVLKMRVLNVIWDFVQVKGLIRSFSLMFDE